MIGTLSSFAQLPQTRITDGIVRTVEDGMLIVPPKGKYDKLVDSLDQNIKRNPNDTTSLFYRSLIYHSYNQLLAAPYQRTKGTLENLTLAKDMTEKSIILKMRDPRLKLLRAQIYAELCFRFTGDESWMFNNSQIQSRKKLFEGYKTLANRYYDELAKADENHAYEYSRKKIKYDYRL